MILEVCEQMKKRVTDKQFFKKIKLWTLIMFCYRQRSYHNNTGVTGVCIAYMFDRNSGGKKS